LLLFAIALARRVYAAPAAAAACDRRYAGACRHAVYAAPHDAAYAAAMRCRDAIFAVFSAAADAADITDFAATPFRCAIAATFS